MGLTVRVVICCREASAVDGGLAAVNGADTSALPNPKRVFEQILEKVKSSAKHKRAVTLTSDRVWYKTNLHVTPSGLSSSSTSAPTTAAASTTSLSSPNAAASKNLSQSPSSKPLPSSSVPAKIQRCVPDPPLEIKLSLKLGDEKEDAHFVVDMSMSSSTRDALEAYRAEHWKYLFFTPTTASAPQMRVVLPPVVTYCPVSHQCLCMYVRVCVCVQESSCSFCVFFSDRF